MITKYKDGSNHLPYHADNETELSDNSEILTISLGETRNIKFRATNDHTSELSVRLCNGDAFIMTKTSQNHFEHSIPRDYSRKLRISITLRNIEPEKDTSDHIMSTQDMIIDTLNNLGNRQPNLDSESTDPANSHQYHIDGYQYHNASPPFEQQPMSEPPLSTTPQHASTIYISSSMFRELDAIKLSSGKQKAARLFYSGASTGEMLSRLQSDTAFKKLDPRHVTKIYLLCGSNNVDRILHVPRSHYTTFLGDNFRADSHQLSNTTNDMSKLIYFLHDWAKSASVNIIGILPRVSRVRNEVINDLNCFLRELCRKCQHFNFISTELNRNLFCTNDGYRKAIYFNVNGADNIHLNPMGVTRLGKHLKFLAHND